MRSTVTALARSARPCACACDAPNAFRPGWALHRAMLSSSSPKMHPKKTIDKRHSVRRASEYKKAKEQARLQAVEDSSQLKSSSMGEEPLQSDSQVQGSETTSAARPGSQDADDWSQQNVDILIKRGEIGVLPEVSQPSDSNALPSKRTMTSRSDEKIKYQRVDKGVAKDAYIYETGLKAETGLASWMSSTARDPPTQKERGSKSATQSTQRNRSQQAQSVHRPLTKEESKPDETSQDNNHSRTYRNLLPQINNVQKYRSSMQSRQRALLQVKHSLPRTQGQTPATLVRRTVRREPRELSNVGIFELDDSWKTHMVTLRNLVFEARKRRAAERITEDEKVMLKEKMAYPGFSIAPETHKPSTSWKVPWAVQPSECTSGKEQLSKEIEKFVAHAMITPAERVARPHVIQELVDHLKTRLPSSLGLEFKVFGSELSDTTLPDSDIDIRVIETSPPSAGSVEDLALTSSLNDDVSAADAEGAESNGKIEDASRFDDTSSIDEASSIGDVSSVERKAKEAQLMHSWSIMRKIAGALRNSTRLYTNVKPVLGTFPIVECVHKPSGIPIQLVWSPPNVERQLAIRQEFLSTLPHMRSTYFVIRALLSSRNLHDALLGGLTSYGIFVAVAAALRDAGTLNASPRDPFASSLTPADQLLQFFAIYKGVDCKKDTIQVHEVHKLPKADFQAAEKDNRPPNPLLPWLLSLRDPADPLNDLAGRAYAIRHIIRTWMVCGDFLHERLSSWVAKPKEKSHDPNRVPNPFEPTVGVIQKDPTSHGVNKESELEKQSLLLPLVGRFDELHRARRRQVEKYGYWLTFKHYAEDADAVETASAEAHTGVEAGAEAAVLHPRRRTLDEAPEGLKAAMAEVRALMKKMQAAAEPASGSETPV